MIKKMKRVYLYACLPASVLPAAAGCSTLAFAEKEETILEVIELINFGESGKLTELSAPPFILDGEILFPERSVSDFWKGFRESGFLLRDAQPVVIEEVSNGTFAKFSESREMEIFFSTYLVEKAVCIDLETSDGIVYLLLGEKMDDYPRILGFRGPVR